MEADARQLSNGDAIKIFNERGEFGARANITDDVAAGVVWIRDGSGSITLPPVMQCWPETLLVYFLFRWGQSDYGAQIEVARS